MACLWIGMLSSVANAIQEKPNADQLHFFESKIRPLLIDRCIDCHSHENPENHLSLESKQAMLRGGDLGPAIVPGKPHQSLLIGAINHDGFLKMPPKEKLSTADVVNLTNWVQMGAPWTPGKEPTGSEKTASSQQKNGQPFVFSQKQKDHWAFQPITEPDLPKVKGSNWPRSEIDFFILRQLERQGLKPAPDIDRAGWIRRATFDLLGIPPTYAEISDFVVDPSAHAFEKVVDRLLASPRYGEKWGRHWLDVARFADSNGLDENLSYANAFRYRDYVIRSFNRDKSYDRFVREQIAGDLLSDPKTTPKTISDFDPHIATGFLAIGPKMLAEDDPMKMQMDIIDEQLSTLGQSLMGMTIGCARCHDHKFDPIPTDDYYSLAGIFKSTKTMENHKVVAVWYERPLISKELQATLKQHEAMIEATESQLSKLVEEAKKKIQQEALNHLDEILVESISYQKFDQAAPEAL
ncbi:MAG: DUF1549 domain-containing protein, partial [Planctomycetota bacterium]|nr:DUF1549 domain-containing protein [Planctomycetota bacterium]